ncbi:hypothetical protein HMY34_03100 [Thiothrix subterranea]|uniref:hypothetical protein n=1 Tax=Thiothrix subterranea TaxID=2735563 RepID=UPI00192CD7D9|nr:hypothetical protein [Thiothrix subterranea]QQZ27822.1 hypothetical protein HMY34_03100 [Thiothrix subterranea]
MPSDKRSPIIESSNHNNKGDAHVPKTPAASGNIVRDGRVSRATHTPIPPNLPPFTRSATRQPYPSAKKTTNPAASRCTV